SGKRERDPRNGFVTPYRPNWRNSHDVLFKPAWLLEILRHGLPGMANFEGYKFSSPAGTDIATAVGREMDASFDWEYLKRLRDLWPRKLLLKGVERPDDAERARAIGCDGVVVSNHGGRQLDGAAPSLEALPAVVRAVGSKMTVLLDGGVRRGVDILKARALGAQAVHVVAHQAADAVGHVKDHAQEPGGDLHARGAHQAGRLVLAEGRREIAAGFVGARGEADRVLQRHGGALREILQHEMRRVAEQRHRPGAPVVHRLAEAQHPAADHLRH